MSAKNANDNLFINGEEKGGVNASDQGRYEYDNGAVYVGTMVNGKFNGVGKLTFYKNNEHWYYEGEFKNDKLHGKGVLHYGEGYSHEGTWENDKCLQYHGQ